jgi:hypothetical protein
MPAGTICLPITFLPRFTCYVATVSDATCSALRRVLWPLFALEEELELPGVEYYISNQGWPSTFQAWYRNCCVLIVASFHKIMFNHNRNSGTSASRFKYSFNTISSVRYVTQYHTINNLAVTTILRSPGFSRDRRP